MSLFELKKITIGPETLTASLALSPSAPVLTSDNMDATQRIYNLMPQIASHACVSAKGDVFRAALPSTETAHLLEHMVVEIMSRLDLAEISSGNTAPAEGMDRTWNITLACPNDVLTVGALSSALWILEWAYTGGKGAKPDMDSIVKGLISMAGILPAPPKVSSY